MFSSYWEPGYNLINWVIANLGGDFHYFLLIVGAFINFSVLRFIYKYSDSVWLSVIVYIAFGFYFNSLHILRQYMALSIVLYSYDYLLSRNFVKFSLIVVIATFFHTSAALFILTYFVVRQKLSTPNLLIIFSVFTVIAFVGGQALMQILVFSEKYQQEYLNNTDTEGSGFSMLVLMMSLMGMGLLLKPRVMSPKMHMIFWSFFIAVCLQPLATIVSMVSRGILYWSVSIVIFIPMIIGCLKNKNLRLAAYSVVTFGLIAFFFFITNALEGIETYATYAWYLSE